MKQKLIIGFQLLLVLTLSFSCKKYEEGPGISFRSAKSRLLGKWKITSFTANNQEQLNAWKYDNEQNVYCTSSGEKIILEGPGTQRGTFKEISFEFLSNSELKWYSLSVQEVLDKTASETLCKAVWNKSSSGEWNQTSNWEFDEKKKNIISKSGINVSTYEILMLKNKKMKLRRVDAGGTSEFVMDKIK